MGVILLFYLFKNEQIIFHASMYDYLILLWESLSSVVMWCCIQSLVSDLILNTVYFYGHFNNQTLLSFCFNLNHQETETAYANPLVFDICLQRLKFPFHCWLAP